MGQSGIAAWYQTPAHGAFAAHAGLLGRRITCGALEHMDNSQQVNRLYAFFLVYGAETVLPSDIRHDSPRVAAYVESDNEQAWQDALDDLEEERKLAASRSAIYQQDLRRYHSRRVRSHTFRKMTWCSV